MEENQIHKSEKVKSGRRYVGNADSLTKKKGIVIILIAILISMLTIESSVSFFSDTITSFANAIIGNVDIIVSDVLIEKEDIVDRNDHNAIFGEEVPVWLVGDVNNFKWTIMNTGNSSISLTNTLRIAWDTSEELSVKDVIYVYPMHMSDDEIRIDMIRNNAANAIISYRIPEAEIVFQNGDIRTGFELKLEDVMESVDLHSYQSYTYEFKIAFGIRPNRGKTLATLINLCGRDLRVEIETNARLLNSQAFWNDRTYATIRLRNAGLNTEHPIFELYPLVSNIEIFLNGEEEVSVPLGSNFIDLGATLLKNGQDISYRLVITGEVNTDVSGEYIITYSYFSEETNQTYTVSRKVVVVSPIELVLKGAEEVLISLGDSFIDPGAILTKRGEDISYRLVITGEVNTDVSGEYMITYSYFSEETNQRYIVNRRVVVMPNVVNGGEFGYTGSVQMFVVPETGQYLLEVWGARGGNNPDSSTYGRGGYSRGLINLTVGEVIYVYVGGRGLTSEPNTDSVGFTGGFNGGGRRRISCKPYWRRWWRF